MTEQESVAWIHALPHFSSTASLDRVRVLLERLGNPHKGMKYIHVAGTNGKGSTVALCAGALLEAGYQVGMNISPYVVQFRERLQVNREMITPDALVDLVEQVRPVYDWMICHGYECNQYDLITALGFLYFRQSRCDVVCLEVGLGGRVDATNIIDPPEVAVITKLSYDHTAVLGNTIEQIAREKAGIIKPGCVCVCSPNQQQAALGVLMERCARCGVPLVQPNWSALEIERIDDHGSRFYYGEQLYQLSLPGEHQIANAVTAIEAIRACRSLPVSQQQLERGLAGTYFPARMERLREHPLVVVDGAHNPGGMQAFVQALKLYQNSPKAVVLGVVRDKDYQRELDLLDGKIDLLIATSVQNKRGLAGESLARFAAGHQYPVQAEPDPFKAYQTALAFAGERGGVFVVGSLYLASDLRKFILDADK